jgi:ABC-type uncharacterized transport system permease subunit
MFKKSQIINGVAVFLIGSGIIWMMRRASASTPRINPAPAAAPGGTGPNFVPVNPSNSDILEV